MNEEFWRELLQAAGWFFMNPVWLFAILVAVGLGYFRVKRERRHFLIRLQPGLTELRRLIPESVLYGVVLSVLIGGIGLTADPGFIVLFSAIALVFMLTFYFQLMSPIYAMALSFFGLYFLQRFDGSFELFGWSVSGLDLFGDMAITVPVIAGLLLIAEGLLIRTRTADYASPALKATKRGLKAAVFKAKRLYLLPVVFVIPGDWLPSYLPYWPQFTAGTESFAFLPVPVVIGFSQMAIASFPDYLYPKIGQAVAFTGAAVVLIGASAYFMPILGWTALIAGVVCRAAITIITAVRERRGHYVGAPQSSGVMIAGVLPDSPGAKLGLMPGECIRAVNGVQVATEKELYDAIQINAAHCRLQVIGRDGEVRLAQQVLYRHDHHRLGLLVVR